MVVARHVGRQCIRYKIKRQETDLVQIHVPTCDAVCSGTFVDLVDVLGVACQCLRRGTVELSDEFAIFAKDAQTRVIWICDPDAAERVDGHRLSCTTGCGGMGADKLHWTVQQGLKAKISHHDTDKIQREKRQ